MITAALSLIDFKKLIQDLTSNAARTGAKTLFSKLGSSAAQKHAKKAIEIFAQEFLTELEDKTPLQPAIPGYTDQLKLLIQSAAPEIAACLQPAIKDADLIPVETRWRALNLDPLPEDFDWPLLAKNFARQLRAYINQTPELRDLKHIELQDQQLELQSRLAGPDSGFNLDGYRHFLRQKCGALQLSSLHTSTYDRRIALWSVFVPQSARPSVPVPDVPRELLRRLREEKQLQDDKPDVAANLFSALTRLCEAFQNAKPVPVLEAVAHERLTVILGDPGSGKTSLLKFLAMQWLESSDNSQQILPLWVDLREYERDRRGILAYLASGCSSFHLDARALDEKLGNAEATLYLDGLDEIFDGPTRRSVIEEIAVFSAQYPKSRIIVTSRLIGYDADRLRNAGFVHLTLEEFDDSQIQAFLAKWHNAAEDDPKERLRLSSQLKTALKESEAVRELVGNPLLLTMAAILNRTQPLPRNRVELYEQSSRVLLREWDASRSLPADEFDRQEKEALLRNLAGVMQEGEAGLAGNLIGRQPLIQLFQSFLNGRGILDPHTKARALVDQLTQRNFILCYAGADHFSFVHRTFLEYFCAAWFVEAFEKKQTLTLDQLKTELFGRHWQDESWHEVLRLVVGMVGEKQGEELILFLLDQDGTDHKLANIALAAQCLSEVRNRQSMKQTDKAVRDAVLNRGIRYRPLSAETSAAEVLENYATRSKFAELLASGWREPSTHDWLRKTIGNDSDHLVQSVALVQLAFGWGDDPETIKIIKHCAEAGSNHSLRVTALLLLALRVGDPEALAIVTDSVRSDESPSIRAILLRRLARQWKDNPETRTIIKDRARTDEDPEVRRAAIEEVASCWPDDNELLAVTGEHS